MKKQILMFMVAVATMVGVSSNIFGQLAQRVVVIEEYTSATCVPCLLADAALKPIVKLSNGVIAIKYHQPIPFKGDPFYVANISENKARNDFYAVGSAMPAARLNGNTTIDPTDGNKVLEAAKTSQSQPYPVRMTVIQDKTDKNNIKVKVTINSDVALDKYTLRAAVTVHDITLEKLPLLPPDYVESLEHWNESKEFADAMLKMLPDVNGTPISIVAGGSQTIDLNYKAEASDLWKFDQLTVVAFLQNNATSEIIQGATTLSGTIGSLISTSLSYPPSVAPIFAAKAANEFVETKIVIGNLSAATLSYEGFTVVKSARTPVDWPMTVSDPATTFTLDAGKSREITVRLTRGASIGTGEVVLNFKESGATGRAFSGIPITIVSAETEGFLVLDNPTSKNEPYNSAMLARTKGKKYVEISSANIIRYSDLFLKLKNIVWNCSDSGSVDTKEFTFINLMMNKGVSTVISGQFITNFANFNGGQPMFDLFGIRYDGKVIRDAAFRLAGVAGDALSDGVNDSCSIKGNYPFYTVSMKKPTKADATPFLRLSTAAGDSIAAVRYQAPTARMIYFAVNPNIIQNVANRNSLIDKALTWVESFTFTPKSQITSLDTLDFGTAVNFPEEKEVVITNTGNIPYSINKISYERKDSLFYPIVSSGSLITLLPGEKLTLKIRFVSPGIGGLFQTKIVINSGSPDSLAIWIKGISTLTDVNENILASSFLSIHPNPVSESMTISYSTNENKQSYLMLSDILGKEVLRIDLGVLSIGTYSSSIETNGLPIGAYNLVFTSGSQRMQAPVMIVR